MGNTVKTVGWLLVFILVVWGGVVLVSQNVKTAEKAPEPIKIGVIAPLTGDAAAYGEPARNVYQLAAEEINAAGGINGQPIELIIEDGKCTGEDGSRAAEKLVTVDLVQAVIGGICSSETLSSVPIAEAHKAALFSPAATSTDLTGISPYFFRNYPPDASQGRTLADAANSRGWKKIAFLKEQTDYASGIYNAFAARFEELGGTVVMEEAPSSAAGFRSQLAKLKGANADALFVDTETPAVSLRVFEEVQGLKWKPALIVNDAISGNAAAVTAHKDLLEGALAAEFVADPNNPKLIKLLADYKAKYGADLSYGSSYGAAEYDAIYMIRDAILAVGYSGEKIAAWSRTVKDWEGASGKVTIKADGDRDGGHTVLLIKDGKTERLAQ